MRTLIYARYSSLLQNARSIEDQVALLRDRAAREGWPIVDVFTDHAISGAAGIGEAARPGLSAMLDRVEAGGIDQVLAEATDRLARHQGDAFAIRERITYAGARLFTLTDGEVTEYTAAFKGLMDAQFRKELGAKIKRGQRGTVAAGRAPAGLAYGYRKANRIGADGNPTRGLRAIDAEQAAIVLRIFERFAAGQSSRTIAQALNADGVPGPRGNEWTASTIHGDRIRHNGMLQNRLYIGELVHNRTSKVVDPRTRRVRIRPNPEADWIREAVPALRIVGDELWNAVQARREQHSGSRPEAHRRPKRLLSGLVTCGRCGRPWVVIGLNRWGCGHFRAGGNCDNNRTILNELLERRVLHGLRERMLDPDLVAIFVREYHREYAKRAAAVARSRDALERDLANAAARVKRLVAAIAAGGDEFEEIRDALSAAKADRDAAAAEIADLEAVPVVALHPTIAADYRRQVAALGDWRSEGEGPARLRALIDRIVISPADTARGVKVELEGRLATIVALATGKPLSADVMMTDERVKGISCNHKFMRSAV